MATAKFEWQPTTMKYSDSTAQMRPHTSLRFGSGVAARVEFGGMEVQGGSARAPRCTWQLAGWPRAEPASASAGGLAALAKRAAANITWHRSAGTAPQAGPGPCRWIIRPPDAAHVEVRGLHDLGEAEDARRARVPQLVGGYGGQRAHKRDDGVRVEAGGGEVDLLDLADVHAIDDLGGWW